MNPPSRAERISFWKHSYARSSFVEGRLECELLLKENPPPNSTLRRALTNSIVTLYMRPFKQRPNVRLSDDIVPSEFKTIHNDMEEIRDKSIAHRDLDGPVAGWGFISRVRVVIESGELTIPTISSILTNERAQELLPLLDALIRKMNAAQSDFVNKHLVGMHASDGTYVISLDESPSAWLLRTEA